MTDLFAAPDTGIDRDRYGRTPCEDCGGDGWVMSEELYGPPAQESCERCNATGEEPTP